MAPRPRGFVIAVCALLAFASVTASAATPSKCSSAKLRATSKKASTRAKCYAKAVAKGQMVDGDCLSKASSKFSAGFTRAESKGDCRAPNGDAPAIESKVDSFVDNVRNIVNSSGQGPNRCDSKKIRAAGKKASNEAKCHAKAVAHGASVDSTCLGKAETKFSSSISKAETAAGCTHTGQTNQLESAVNAFIDDAVSELTSCGNGTIDPGEDCDDGNIGGATCGGSAGGAFVSCKPDCTLDCSRCPGGACQVTCEPIVPNQPIPNTYQLLGVAGPKLCQTNSAANAFKPCNSDSDCGGASGSCLQTPWITADGFAFQFPTGISTVFTVAAADPAPTCNHSACISCGNPAAACTGIPGCGSPPDAPQNGCSRNTCCDTPGFTVPTFNIPILGGLCGRVDQVACGLGVVNTSHPQTGDNEVTKTGDTSDPGPDCVYGTGDDPVVQPACTVVGEGADTKGKVVKTIGNGSPDVSGIHFRLPTPMLATVWQDSENPCPPGSTFDSGEGLISQLVLSADPTSAGATGSFSDLNGDGCKHAGTGFSSASPDGPITVGSLVARPQSYDGTVGAIQTAAGPIFSGAAPLYDIGFVGVLPSGPATVQPAETCTCVPVAGCPE